MATFIFAATVRSRFNRAPSGLEQQAQVERAGSIAALTRATICRLGLGQPPLLFKQATEVRGGRPMAALISATIGRPRFHLAPLGLEQQAQVESSGGLSRREEIRFVPPRQPGLRAITAVPPSGVSAMPVCVNLVFVVVRGDSSTRAIRQCDGKLLPRRLPWLAARRCRDSGLDTVARARAPHADDQHGDSEDHGGEREEDHPGWRRRPVSLARSARRL